MNRASQSRFVARQLIALRKTIQNNEALVLMIINKDEVHLVLEELYPGHALLRAQKDYRPVLQIVWTKVTGIAQLYPVERSPRNLIELRHNVEIHYGGIPSGHYPPRELWCGPGSRSGMAPIIATEVFR
jgi:hypothetical protein